MELLQQGLNFKMQSKVLAAGGMRTVFKCQTDEADASKTFVLKLYHGQLHNFPGMPESVIRGLSGNTETISEAEAKAAAVQDVKMQVVT